MDPKARIAILKSVVTMQMRNKGFTLIEILIVIVIISIVASVATLTIHFNRNKQMETLANQLVDLINLAEEEAILRPAVLGLALTANSFQIYSYQEKDHAWEPLKNHVFRAREIPDHMQIVLKIHNKIIPANGIPQLIISQSGDIPAFILSIGQAKQPPLYQVIGEESGNVYAK